MEASIALALVVQGAILGESTALVYERRGANYVWRTYPFVPLERGRVPRR
jgi:hypothetical protein